jgi:hypothetical protein
VDRHAKTIQTFTIAKIAGNADKVENAENRHPRSFN